MAYEAKKTIRQGEAVPVYGGASCDRGLLTLSAGATFSLYDGIGAIVLEDQPVSGVSATPAKEFEVWYLLDADVLPFGMYFGLFRYQATASADALGRRDRPGVQIEVLAPVEVPAVWGLETLEGKTRLYLGDRRRANPIWSSDEVLFLLSETGQVPIKAAALGFDVAAGQESYLALYETTQIFKVDRRDLPEALRKQADQLRDLADTELALAAETAGSVDESVVMIFPPTSWLDQEPNFARPWGVAGTCPPMALTGVEERARRRRPSRR